MIKTLRNVKSTRLFLLLLLAVTFIAVNANAQDGQTSIMAKRQASSNALTPVSNLAGTGTLNFVAKWIDGAGTLGNSMMFDNGTRVGVGTTTPQAYFQVGPGADVPNFPGTRFYVVGDMTAGQTGATGIVARDNLNHVELAIGTAGLGGGQFVGLFGTRTPHDLYLQANGNNFMVVKTSGRVGIGTLTPTATLDVAGNVNVSGNIAAKYQDVAEWVATDGDPIDGGALVVLSTDKTNSVRESSHAYDTAVAGVVSDRPGILLGEAGELKAKIATTGRVKVHADASNGAIAIGDLLVTSDRVGFAMRSNPVDVGGIKMHRPGTIVGKALEPLKSGQGDILVLLTLQ